MDLLETYGPQDDCGRSSVSPLHPISGTIRDNTGAVKNTAARRLRPRTKARALIWNTPSQC